MTDPGSPSGLPLRVVCQGKQSRSTPLPPTTPASCVPWRWKAKGCGVRFGTKEVLTRLLGIGKMTETAIGVPGARRQEENSAAAFPTTLATTGTEN